jgi:outer membrane murein-binding lipoprotein Lpp
MARPERNVIASGEAAWDGEVDSNFAMLTDAPFPLFLVANTSLLPAAGGYDACLALVGTTANAKLYISNGTSWVAYQQAAHQANTTAADVAAMATDFNALLAKLQAAGIMASA